ncbi:MAG TPA: hypothetical protein VFC63_17190 [Blastocatellia bacterium]|nr:hypothetical protein [Blastocatellia bacterium]
MSTQPTIETVLERLQEFRASMDQRLNVIENEQRQFKQEVLTELRLIDRQLGILSQGDLRYKAELRELEERLERLEVNPNAPTGRLP